VDTLTALTDQQLTAFYRAFELFQINRVSILYLFIFLLLTFSSQEQLLASIKRRICANSVADEVI
jgi:hypothetical protein